MERKRGDEARSSKDVCVDDVLVMCCGGMERSSRC